MGLNVRGNEIYSHQIFVEGGRCCIVYLSFMRGYSGGCNFNGTRPVITAICWNSKLTRRKVDEAADWVFEFWK